MKLIFLLFPIIVFSQAPPGFHEISPEREKLLRQIEEKEENRKKKLAEMRKKEELAIKRAAEAREKAAFEIEAAKKKKAEVEEYTKWLISERDRKMRETALKPTVAKKINSHPSPEREGPSPGCSLGAVPMSWYKDFLGKNSTSPMKSYVEKTLCSCRFSPAVKFPDSMKVISVETYQGTDVTINVKDNGPVALALDSYEPVRWKIHGRVEAVFVLGFSPQEISVEGRIPLIVSTVEGGNNLCGAYEYMLSGQMYGRKGMNQQMNAEKLQKLRDVSQLLYGREPEQTISLARLPAEITIGD